MCAGRGLRSAAGARAEVRCGKARAGRPARASRASVEGGPELGEVGDTTCANSDNELFLGKNNDACLSLLRDTITAADCPGLMLARVRVMFVQPGLVIDGKTADWVLYATRTRCSTEHINVMDNVVRSLEGVEVSPATAVGGRLALPEGLAAKTLLK